MSPFALALALTLTQAPCQGERVVLLPLQPVALSAAEARGVEERVRRAMDTLPGVCLEPRAETVARLRARGGRLAGCSDAACRGAQVAALGARRLVRGSALGVGGSHAAALTLVDREGHETQATLELASEGTAPADGERLRAAFAAVWSPGEGPGTARARGPWPTVLWAAGGVALAAGVGFGLASRGGQSALSTGAAGCAGEGAVFRDCVTQRLQRGRLQARTANALWGAGALLGVGGTVLFVWELP
ncbi:hypothetical protein [Archangium primigenium]|uniref:hypothetical protein n=1 Tax=[Archangium] primigenium TaxID=2792470 RepID=UPI001EF8BBA9|nr:hypothetical protein [Archangium primigenium]